MFITRLALRIRTQGPTGIRYARRWLVHSSPKAQTRITEKVTEAVDKANKSVGKGLADAIGKGEKAANAAKDTIESVKGTTTKGKKTEEALKKVGEKTKKKRE